MNGDTNDPGNELQTEDANLDPSGEFTPEDHLAKMKLAMLANEAMKRVEAETLQTQWHQPAPAVPPDTPGYEEGRGIGVLRAPPPPANRMYMGPNVGAPGATPAQFFGNAPTGTNVNLAPPPPQITPPDTLTQLQSADRPGTRTISIQPPNQRLTPMNASWTPAHEQWAAQQDLKADIDKGMTPEQALLKHPAAVTGTARRSLEMTPAQTAANQIAQRRLSLQESESKRKTGSQWLAGDVATHKENAARIAAIKKNLDALGLVDKPTEAQTKMFQRLATEANRLRQENDALAGKYMASPITGTSPQPDATPKGKPVTDKNGKTWLYTGTSANPKTDKDPSHWLAQ